MSTLSLKLKFGADIRRLAVETKADFASVHELVAQSYNLVDDFVLKFVDDEGDLCTITNDDEVLEAFTHHSPKGALTLQVSLKSAPMVVSSAAVAAPVAVPVATVTAAPTTEPVAEPEPKPEEKQPEPMVVSSAAVAAPAAVPVATVTAAPTTEPVAEPEPKPEGKRPEVVQSGRADRDTNWRRRRRTNPRTWKQSSGRSDGRSGYEVGDMSRTFQRLLVDPESGFNATVRAAEKGLNSMLTTIDKEGRKFWSGGYQEHLKKLAKDAESEGKKIWKGEPPYDAYYASLKDFVNNLQLMATKLLTSQEPYNWQKAIKQGGAKTTEVMQIARKEAAEARQKFMAYASKEADKIFREAMTVTKQMVNVDWKLAIENGIKDAKYAMNEAKANAKELVKMAKQARREKKNKKDNAGGGGGGGYDSSSDSADEALEVAKAKSRDLKQEARAVKEAYIREVRAKANHQRQATLAKARTQARLLKAQMMDVATTEAKQLRKSIVAQAREGAKKAEAAAATAAVVAEVPSAPPAAAAAPVAALAPAPAPHVYQQQLDLLKSMGFEDENRNKDLLMRHKGNLPQVCNALIGV